MQLHFLGTGAGVPAKERNVSSLAIKQINKKGGIWLFDCGEATQHQILHTSIKPRRIEKIFITHLHGDHIFGLPGLIGSRSFQGGTEPLSIYGPAGTKEYIETSLRISGTHLKYELFIHEITDQSEFEDAEYQIKVFKLDHALDSFGYRLTEKDKPGTLMVDKLRETGLPPGPLYNELKNGKSVEWNGQTLKGEDYLEEPKKGMVIAVAGDTRKTPAAIKLARGADVLIHEATFGAGHEEMAYQYYHSTATQAAETAREAGVKELWLTHISARYTGDTAAQLLSEARTIFSNTNLAYDLLEAEIEKK
ncbi:ribonuclease Z [Jeotgalibacillus sp. R-1-5s-1]|uniref:ribonuclease Z n=1 Tax=Jeotgalibacillus sp. R-1-5s-1 TaxID=2555897 RepID=UPI00106BA29F|nr:ribonuclease Z [Jeotgalibacillus sp. R-1-5s-1]TFD92214.1 ribonuclease Z [Jeotgalibacillus sp. R-1-5s-1]